MNTGLYNTKNNHPGGLFRRSAALVGKIIRWARRKMTASGGTNGIWL